MATVAELKAKKKEYIDAKGILSAVYSSTNDLYSNISSCIEPINSGVVIGGKGIDGGLLPGQRDIITSLRGSLSSMISHCDTKIQVYQNLIDAALSKDGLIPKTSTPMATHSSGGKVNPISFESRQHFIK